MGRIQSASFATLDNRFTTDFTLTEAPVALHKASPAPAALSLMQDGLDQQVVGSWQLLGLVDRGDLAGNGGGRVPPPGKPQAEPPWWLTTNQQLRQWEAAHGPTFDVWHDELYTGASPAIVDAKLTQLETDLQTRYTRYLRLANQSTDPQMHAYYRDLYIAMQTDLNDVARWKALSNDAKIQRFNRVAFEAAIEVKYNVALMTDADAKPWTVSDLRELERGLSKLPAKFTTESDKLWILRREAKVITPKGSHGGEFDPGTNVISIADVASNYPGRVEETILHEVGHSQQPPPDIMAAFKTIADWRLVGPQDLPALAAYSHGDWAQAKTLKAAGVPGLDNEDPGRWFRISKTDGNAYIVPSQAPPDNSSQLISNYSLSSPAEDWAETFMYYYLHRDEMKTKFPEKFRFMQAVLGQEGG
jgi:hypothetical protein